MFGFGRSGNSGTSGQVGTTGGGSSRSSVSTVLRDGQIASLLSENPTMSQSKPGVFQLGLQLPDKKIIVLRVALGDTFPTTPPVLQIMTHATHPWLSTDGYCRVVGHPDLGRWNPHCNLGKMDKEVVTEFCTRPPVPVSPGNEGYAQKQQGPTAADTGGGKTAYRESARGGGGGGGSKMDVDTSTLYNALQDITVEQHKEQVRREIAKGLKQIKDTNTVQLLVDASKKGYRTNRNSESAQLYSSFLNDNVSCIETWNSVIEEQLEQNAERAKANLEKKAEVEGLATTVTALQRELKEQEELYRQHLVRQDKIAERFRPSTVYKQVMDSANRLEEESEEVAYDFHNGTDVNVNEFLKVFLDKRMLSHRRRSMAEAFRKANGLA